MVEQILGKFNGESLVGIDGKIYPINENYASKSKLVEGDELKLYINEDNQFVYKQINRVEVARIRGKIKAVGRRFVSIGDNGVEYRILKSTYTYFKLNDGDEVVLIIPKDMPATYAAIENVIHPVQTVEEKELEA